MLLDAILEDDMAHITELLKEGANVDARDRHTGQPAIMLARSREVMSLLMNTGANLKATDDKGRSVIACTSWYDLLPEDTDVNQQDEEGNTPLMHAITWYDKDKIDWLLAHGANIHLRNHDGYSCLDISISHGFTGLTQLLIDAGAVITCPEAAAMNSVSWLDRCLEEGLSIDAKNASGETALFVATQFGYRKLAEYLILNEADVNLADCNGTTPLMEACGRSCHDMALLLIEAGADIHARNNEGWTALMAASYAGMSDMVKRLLQCGAEREMVDRYGMTAEKYALQQNHYEIARMLS